MGFGQMPCVGLQIPRFGESGKRTVPSLFRFYRKTAARQLFFGQVHVKTVTTDRVIGAPGIGTGATRLIDLFIRA